LIADPLELPAEAVDPIRIEQRPEGAECRAESADCHAHVVECNRVGALPNLGLGAVDLDELFLEGDTEELGGS
jgi:hypothetical protein